MKSALTALYTYQHFLLLHPNLRLELKNNIFLSFYDGIYCVFLAIHCIVRVSQIVSNPIWQPKQ
jgi:hypothetical protein